MKSDFRVISLEVGETTHQMLIKKHVSTASDSQQLIPGQTAFLMNVPLAPSLAVLRRYLDSLFAECQITHVECKYPRKSAAVATSVDSFILSLLEEDSDNVDMANVDSSHGVGDISGHMIMPGSFVYCVFDSPEALDTALSVESGVWSDTDPDKDLDYGFGLKRWKREFLSRRVLDIDQYQQELDGAMMSFDSEAQQKHAEMLAKRNVVDEDGWTVVTKAGRRNTNTDGKITVTAAKARDIQNLAPKEQGIKDFYRFQMRANKIDRLSELKNKFQEDRKRIAILKDSRKFKPY